MAGKRNLEADYPSFDMDLDLDFNTDISSELNQEATEPKKRSVVSNVVKGALQGTKDTLTSPQFIHQTLKKALPSAYGEITESLGEVSQGSYELYDETVRELKPRVNRIMTKIDSMVPETQKGLKSITKKIVERTGTSTYADYDNRTNQEEQTVNQISQQIFGQGFQHESPLTAAKGLVKEEIEKKRFESSSHLLGMIANNTSIQAQYTTSVTQRYQKKMLELQLRGFLAQQDYYRKSLKYREANKVQNEAIIKNTSLPEYLKITNSERFMEMTRNKFFESLYGDQSVLKKGIDRLKQSAKEFVGGISLSLDNIDMVLDSAQSGKEQIQEMNKTLIDMGEEPLTAAEMAGATAASSAIGYFRDIVAKRIKNKTEQTPQLNEGLSKLASILKNPAGSISELQKKDWWQENLNDPSSVKGKLTKAGDFILEHFKDRDPSREFGRTELASELGGLSSPVMGFDKKAHISLVDVIPGHLAAIHREIAMMRTGTEDVPLQTYDYQRGEFVSKKQLASRIKESLSSEVRKSQQDFKLNEASDYIRQDHYLDNDEEIELKRFLSRLSRVSNIQYTKENIENTSAYESLSPSVKRVVDRQLSMMSEGDNKEATSLAFTKQIQSIRKATPSLDKNINDYIQAGYGDALTETGIVKRTDKGSFKVDEEAYAKFLEEEGIVRSDINVKQAIRQMNPTELLKTVSERFRKTKSSSYQLNPYPRMDESFVPQEQGLSKKWSPQEAFDGFKKTKLYNWFYQPGKGDKEPHSGPMAQEVRKNFGEEAAPDGKRIDLQSMNGATMAAIKHLGDQVDKLGKGGRKVTNDGLLYQIRQDTASIVKLLSSESKRLGKVVRSSQGNEDQDEFGSKDDYRSLLSSTFKNVLDLATRVSGDVYGAASRVFTVGKDKVAKPALDFVSQSFDNNKGAIKEGLSSLFGKATALAGSVLEMGQKTLMEHLPAGFKELKNLAKKTAEGLSKFINSAKDLYLPGMTEPVIQAFKLKAGYYYDSATGKAIETIDQLLEAKENIVDKFGNVILTAEDKAQGLYDRKGEKIKSTFMTIVKGTIGAASYVKDKITSTVSQLKEGSVKTFGQFKDFIKDKFQGFDGLGKGFRDRSYEVLVDIRDILLGDKESVFERLKKKPKGISPLSSETPQIVVEKTSEVAETSSTDVPQVQAPNTTGFLGGMVDAAKGLGGKLGGLKDKVLGKAKDTVTSTAATAATAATAGKGLLGKGLGVLKGIGGGLGSVASGLGGLLGSATPTQDPQSTPKEKPLTTPAQQILVKKTGEKAWNDKDGDGRRDGSVEERQERLEELKRSRTKQGAEADLSLKYKQGNIFDNLLGKLGGLFSFLSSGFSGVMSLLGSGFTKLTGLGGLLTKSIGSAASLASRAVTTLGSLAKGAGGLLGSAKAGLSAVGGKIASGVGSAIGGLKGLFGAGSAASAASGATGLASTAAGATGTGASAAGAGAAATGATAAKTGLLGKAAGLFNAAKTGVTAIGSKAASIGGTVLRTGLQYGARSAAFMATKALPGAIMAGAKLAGAAVTSIAGAVATPVVIGGAALALAGYGIYKLYQRAKRNNANDYERLRLRQYGFGYNSDVDQYNHHVYVLEEYLQDGRLTYENGKASINERRVNPEEIAEIFNIDKDDQETGEKFAYWYTNRFKPIFLTHITALYAVDGKKKLSEVKDLEPSKLIKYLEATALPEGPYDVTVSPLKALSELSNEKTKIKESNDILISNLRGESSKGSKENILPEKKQEEAKAPDAPYKSKSGAFLDYITGGTFKEKEPLKEGEKQKDLLTLINEKKAQQAGLGTQALTGGETGEDGPQTQQLGQAPTTQSLNNLSGASAPSSVPEAGGAPKTGQAGSQYLRLGKGVEIEGSNPIMLKHFLGMAEEYGEKTGKTIQVNSGYRSYERQAALHRQFPQKAAAPGRSLHEKGMAIDINSSDANELEKLGLMKKYGFTRPVGGEPWHIEPAGIQKNIALARDNARERDVMIAASLYRGGGGYGTVPNATKYRRNHDLAMRLLEAPGKPAEEPKTQMADGSSTMTPGTPSGSKETIMSGSSSGSGRIGGYNDRNQSGSPGSVSMPDGSATSMNQPTGALNQPASNDGALNKQSATSTQLNITPDTSTTAQEKMPTEEQLWNQAQEAEPQPTSTQGEPLGKASGKGGDIKNEIAKHARKVGVDPSLMQAFAVVESDLNPNARASTSTAAGLYQFIRSTWQEQVAKFGSKYGLKANASPFDVEAATLLASEYVKQNQRYISRVKPDTNFTDLYLSHFLGPGGANKFLSLSPDTIAAQALPQAASANRGIFYSKSGQPLTVRAIYENLSKKLKDKSASYGVNVNAGQGLKVSSEGPGLKPSEGSSPLTTPTGDQTPASTQQTSMPSKGGQGLSLPTPTQSAATSVTPNTSSREMYASSSGGVFVDSRGSSMLARERRESGESFTGPNMGNIETALDKSVGIQQDSLAVLKDILENVKTEKVAEMLAAALATVAKASQGNSADSLKEQDNRNMGRTGRAQPPSLDMSRKVM